MLTQHAASQCVAFSHCLALLCLVLPHFRTAVSRSQQTEATACIHHYKRLLLRLSLAIELGDGLSRVTVYRDKTRTPRQTPWACLSDVSTTTQPASYRAAVHQHHNLRLSVSTSPSLTIRPISFPPSVDLAWSDQRDCRRDRPLAIPLYHRTSPAPCLSRADLADHILQPSSHLSPSGRP